MSKFKPQSAYSNPTPPQPSPTIEDAAAQTPIDSPSPSSTPATESAADLSVVFLIDSVDGEFPLEQSGTPDMVEEIFRRYATEGVTLHNQRGFVWYNPNFIKKITVKF